MAIATVNDVQAVSGKIFDSDEQALVAVLIDQVQGDIEAYLGCPADIKTCDEFYNIPPFQLNLYLNSTPVRAVSSITVNGQALTTDQYWVNRWGITFSYWGYSSLTLNPASWISPTAEYNVIYTGGLDGANLPGIKSTLIRVVLREKAKVSEGDAGRLGYSEVRVEDFLIRKGSVTGSNPADATNVGSLMAADMKMISRYRKRTVLSDRMTPPDPMFRGSGYGYGYRTDGYAGP